MKKVVIRNDAILIEEHVFRKQDESKYIRTWIKNQLDENGIAIIPNGYSVQVAHREYVAEVDE